MMQKGVVALAVLALVALAHPTDGQTTPNGRSPSASSSSVNGQGAPSTGALPDSQLSGTSPSASDTPSGGTSSPGSSDCVGENCNFTPSHITVATPPPVPVQWRWQDRIAWGANLVLVVLGYIGVAMGLSLLRKIERQTRFVEEAMQAVAESSRASLMQVEAQLRAERPWMVVSATPANDEDNGFFVIATNRGRGPARVISTVEEFVCTPDEKQLPASPTYKSEPVAPADPILLLPGESVDLLPFSRTDAQQVCGSDEAMKRVEEWQEKIYLYGKIRYRDLGAPENAPELETQWCFWYIHGRQKSGMVVAGPAPYNRHT